MRKLVNIPECGSKSSKCFTDLKAAYESGKAIETRRSEAESLAAYARSHIHWKRLPFKVRMKTGYNGTSNVWLESKTEPTKSRQKSRFNESIGQKCFTKLETAFEKGESVQGGYAESQYVVNHARYHIAYYNLPFKAHMKTNNGISIVWLERTDGPSV
jgi:hypothetical protein